MQQSSARSGTVAKGTHCCRPQALSSNILSVCLTSLPTVGCTVFTYDILHSRHSARSFTGHFCEGQDSQRDALKLRLKGMGVQPSTAHLPCLPCIILLMPGLGRIPLKKPSCAQTKSIKSESWETGFASWGASHGRLLVGSLEQL